MIQIKNITLRNFLSIGNVTQAVNFDRRDLTLVLGENLDLGGDDSGARNGTGKTTIINALSYALYGNALTNIKKDNLINKTNGKNMLVTIDFEKDGTDCLTNLDAILVPGGFGKRGTEGKISAIRYARENNVPYLGICLGMQLAVIEFARHVAHISKANSTEFDPQAENPVVALITEWLDREGHVETRNNDSDLGGTMRLGSQRCPVKTGTLAHRIYGAEVNERHRHRFEVNNVYVPKLESAGLVISARTPNESLPEMMELPSSMHPWFFGVQFHPEFTSTPRDGHPLFSAFIKAALSHKGITG